MLSNSPFFLRFLDKKKRLRISPLKLVIFFLKTGNVDIFFPSKIFQFRPAISLPWGHVTVSGQTKFEPDRQENSNLEKC